MRKLTKAILPATILVVGIVAAPALYAQSDRGSSGSMTDHGMMGGNNRNDGGGMMGMMKMMDR
jgi:Spy/CpxP family protein refolding chaperone